MTKGVYYILMSIFFFSFINVFVKIIPRIGAVEIIFFRSIVSFIISFAVLKQQKISIWGNNKKWLIIRGISGSIGLLFFFATLKEIPMASAVTFQYLSPIFTSILGIYIVKERFFSIQWLFFLISFIGVILIQGFDSRVTTTHLILGISSAIASGLAYNSIRKLNISEHPLVIIFYFPLISIPVTSILLIFNNWVTPNLHEFAILLAIGLATQFAQYFLTKAYQLEGLSKISSLQYLGIIIAIALGYLFFDENYTVRSFIGIAVVFLGVILNLIFKNKVNKHHLKT